MANQARALSTFTQIGPPGGVFMQPTLVFLAAGIGSRYGGLKQMEPVGPGGAILDYSAYDARRAGFGRIVCVIREDMLADFRERLGDRISRHIPVEYAFQRLESLPGEFHVPPGRTRPWGTGQAVLAAGELVNGPFAVANADDFYGAQAYQELRRIERLPLEAHVLVAYRLRDTLSEHGAVSRGVCELRDGTSGLLKRITEITKIEKRGGDGVYRDESGEHVLPGDTLVSMNLWAFQPSFIDHLRTGFRRFLERQGNSTSAEYYLPAAVQDQMAAGDARVQVSVTSERWCGITHRDDLPAVRTHIAELVERGVYPRDLWR
jgi:hypothetical protein